MVTGIQPHSVSSIPSPAETGRPEGLPPFVIDLITIENYSDLHCGIVHIDQQKDLRKHSPTFYLSPELWKLLSCLIERGARGTGITINHITIPKKANIPL